MIHTSKEAIELAVKEAEIEFYKRQMRPATAKDTAFRDGKEQARSRPSKPETGRMEEVDDQESKLSESTVKACFPSPVRHFLLVPFAGMMFVIGCLIS